MKTLRMLALGSSIALVTLAGPAALAHDHQDAAAQGRSNPGLSAEDESTVMPTNPNAGAGAIGTDGDPYQPSPENGDWEDDDGNDEGY